jgi:hypothetical protein
VRLLLLLFLLTLALSGRGTGQGVVGHGNSTALYNFGLFGGQPGLFEKAFG